MKQSIACRLPNLLASRGQPRPSVPIRTGAKTGLLGVEQITWGVVAAYENQSSDLLGNIDLSAVKGGDNVAVVFLIHLNQQSAISSVLAKRRLYLRV